MRILTIITAVLFFSLGTQANTAVKEWTFLVFLNGHNNLDRFGFDDINEMEKVGSTDNINIVVQWATMKKETTDRLYVTKDDDTKKVSSKVVQSLKRVDMGDYKELVKFVAWAAKKYPAKHYFLTVWNHGSGWHYLNYNPESNVNPNITYTGISFDDYTGNEITTLQLGLAMDQIAAILKKPLDIYGSDACLMAMPEIAAQMRKSVNYFVGSEEVEPGEGWPYDDFLQSWTRFSRTSPEAVITLLTDAYLKSYQNGSQGTRDVTFSAFNLREDRLLGFYAAMKSFSNAIYTLKAKDRVLVKEAIMSTHVFEYSDYGDLVDFINKLQQKGINSVELYRTAELLKRSAIDLILINGASAAHKNAHGAAIWLPSDSYTFNQYWEKYQALDFHKTTGWGYALKSLFSN